MPWQEKSRAEQSALPPGRFVSAATETRLGEVSVAGLVIPYHFAHVRAGRRDRRPWEEHCVFLDNLRSVLDSMAAPRIALGDFNQRIPSTWVKRDARDKLRDAFVDLQVVTAGSIEFNGDRAIDHIACDPTLMPVRVGTLSNCGDEGGRLSDHFGVTVTLEARRK